MPIIGLTDTDSVEARFPRLGKLRKGAPRPENGNMPGRELSYFRFVSPDPNVTAAFERRIGKEPRRLTVFLPYITPDENFSSWCEVWGANGLVHRCDGVNAFIWLDGNVYKRGSIPCPGGHRDDDPLKDAVGRLDVVIPELIEEGFVGYVTLETGGKNDLLEITRVLRMTYEQCDPTNGLRGVPFVLSRVEEEVSAPGFGRQEGKRSKVKKWNVKIAPSHLWVQAKLRYLQESGVGAKIPRLPPSPPVAAEPPIDDIPVIDDDDDIGLAPGTTTQVANRVSTAADADTAEHPVDDEIQVVRENGKIVVYKQSYVKQCKLLPTSSGKQLGELTYDELVDGLKKVTSTKPEQFAMRQTYIAAIQCLLDVFEIEQISSKELNENEKPN